MRDNSQPVVSRTNVRRGPSNQEGFSLTCLMYFILAVIALAGLAAYEDVGHTREPYGGKSPLTTKCYVNDVQVRCR